MGDLGKVRLGGGRQARDRFIVSPPKISFPGSSIRVPSRVAPVRAFMFDQTYFVCSIQNPTHEKKSTNLLVGTRRARLKRRFLSAPPIGGGVISGKLFLNLFDFLTLEEFTFELEKVGQKKSPGGGVCRRACTSAPRLHRARQLSSSLRWWRVAKLVILRSRRDQPRHMSSAVPADLRKGGERGVGCRLYSLPSDITRDSPPSLLILQGIPFLGR